MATAGDARALDYGADAVAVAADLLDHKGPLSDSLEPASATATTGGGRCSGLGLGSFASLADVGPSVADSFGCAVDRVHEVNFDIHNHILAFRLDVATLTSWTFSAEHFLELLEDVTKSPGLFELFGEPFEASEACRATEGVAACKRVLSSERVLSLLVTSHSGLIVDFAFAFVAQGFISVVDLSELFLGFRGLVDVRVVFLCKLEVLLLDVGLGRVAVDFECGVKVFFLVGRKPSLQRLLQQRGLPFSVKSEERLLMSANQLAPTPAASECLNGSVTEGGTE